MELSKARQNIYSQLSKRKMRDRHNLFVVEGRKSVEDTIGVFKAEAVITVDCNLVPESWGCPHILHEVSRPVMEKISSLSTAPDVIAVYCIPEGFYDNVPDPCDGGHRHSGSR